jgi:FtsH-binding integral membrane protein
MEDPGWDHVKNYFRKIMNSFALGLLWMLATVTAGFYFRLAYIDTELRWQTALFYVLLLCSFGALLWYLYKTWKHP